MNCLRCGIDLGEGAIGICENCASNKTSTQETPEAVEDQHEDEEFHPSGVEGFFSRCEELVSSVPSGVWLAVIGLACVAVLLTQIPRVRTTTAGKYLTFMFGGVSSLAEECRQRFPRKRAGCDYFEQACQTDALTSDSCRRMRDDIRMALATGMDFGVPDVQGAPVSRRDALRKATADDLLREAKKTLRLPMVIDEYTRLVEVRAIGEKTLEYVYQVALPAANVPRGFADTMRASTIEKACANELAVAGLHEGFTFRHTYLASDRISVAGQFSISRADCEPGT